MSKLKNLIDSENFRLRTAMYIGDKKLSILKAFFDGYYYCNLNEDYLLDGFDDWISNYYNYKESTSGWKNMILLKCKNDEEKAVDKFFELFDNFKKKTQSKVIIIYFFFQKTKV